MVIGFLGPEGTHSEAAAMWLNERMGRRSELRAFPDIFSAIQAVENGEIESALVPVENSIEGAVNVTLDTLAQSENISVVREVVWDVSNYLMGRNPSAEITAIYSHPQPLAQCRRFLKEHYPNARLIATASTAEAARIVSSPGAGRGGAAAICTARAGAINGLVTIAEDIQDSNSNKTKFYELRRSRAAELPMDEAGTALIIFQIDGAKSGALYEVLGELEKRKVNMTRIESRPPREGMAGFYVFFVDIEIERGCSREPVDEAIAAIRERSLWVKELGRYPKIEARQ